ncbi:MAG: hypothetical protein HRT90_07645 [Candidatus Margulisbacteria bacterium]|nr:hypothetical protein [Candidatus Margulisiibacteriota bacterium]
MTFQLLIQTNSPGELTAWVSPIVNTFINKLPSAHITIFLVPCQYRTGTEFTIAQQIPGVNTVLTPKQTIRTLLSFPLLQRHKGNGAVLYLGGDPFYSKCLGIKFGYPVYAYSEHALSSFFFKKVFLKSVDGDLMADRVRLFHSTTHIASSEKSAIPNHPFCLFFCGSRPQHFINMVPLIIEVVAKIKIKHPDFKAVLHISPFITENDLDQVRKDHDLSHFVIHRGDSLNIMSKAKLLVTLPGTNNAEALYLGLPMLVVVPLNRPELLIFDGLKGLIGNLPIIGKLIKKWVANYLVRTVPYFSLPNKLAKSPIITEMVDVLTPEKISQEVTALYYDSQKLTHIKNQFKKLHPKQNTANNIVQCILKNN